METISSSTSSLGDCSMDIELLCEAFGSAFSLEAIASAYSQASRNVDMAGAILYDMQGQTSTLAPQSKDVLDEASLLSSNDVSQYLSLEDQDIANVVPIDVVSGTGEYVKPTLPSKQGSNGSLATSRSTCKDDERMNEDLEEFLFNMLGDGFQLDKKMISKVIGMCGYDLEKSMETLVDLSATSLGKCDDLVSRTLDREKYMKIGLCSSEGMHFPDSSQRSVNHNGGESSKRKKDKYDLQREILGSLFTAPERVQELPKRIVPQRRVRSSAFGRPVVGPLSEPKIEGTFVTVKPLEAAQEGNDDDNSFVVLRQAVKEYWALMKEYYKAATEAYTKGDKERAERLMKEGQFFRDKALESDEKSTQKVLETSCREDELLFNLSTFKPKEAVEHLKRNLLIFAGMPTFSQLKLTVGNEDDVERKKGGRKRLVLKLLEDESIEWIEVDDGKTIVIQLDKVNPKTLKFPKI